jgi:hypothetical protein
MPHRICRGAFMEIHELGQFLDSYTIIEKDNYEANMFQIAGFPHYENVFSNVLAYFLKNNTVVKSLLDCSGAAYDITADETIEVNREEYTTEGKRIDIVVKTGGLIIGIENKINTGVNNPAETYRGYLAKLAEDENKELICIILSKNKIYRNKIAGIEGFCSITHKDLGGSIRKHYPELIKQLGHRYFFLLHEFVENIDHLQGAHTMDSEFIRLAGTGGNDAKIDNIIRRGLETRDEFIRTAGKIIGEFSGCRCFAKKYVYKDIPDIGYMGATAALQDYFLPEGNYNCTIDVYISVKGFRIDLFERHNNADARFWELINAIVPGFHTDFNINPAGDGRAHYRDTIPLNEYDRLIETVKSITDCFQNTMIA